MEGEVVVTQGVALADGTVPLNKDGSTRLPGTRTLRTVDSCVCSIGWSDVPDGWRVEYTGPDYDPVPTDPNLLFTFAVEYLGGVAVGGTVENGLTDDGQARSDAGDRAVEDFGCARG
jgi:hypothetical protein